MTFLSEDMLGGSRRSLLLLFGAVGFLLLIACANAGNLLFAKGAEARREFAVRFALGASGGELARLVVIQGCALSLAGAVLGVLVAYWSFDGLMSFVPAQLPRSDSISIDSRALGFAFLLSLVSGTTLGLFPAWHLSRGGLHSALQTRERATLPAQRLRLVVLATEVALAVVLLSGAALFGRSFARLLDVDLGFSSLDVLTMQVRTLQSRYPTVDQQRAFLDETLDRIRALPGIVSAAAVELLPVTRARRGGSVVTVDGPVAGPIEAESRVVSSGYFETMNVRLILGRSFNRNDSSGSPRVAIINQALARRLWPGLNPIGRRIRYEKEELGEVVGVVGDVRGYSVDTRPEPQVYVPYLQTWLVPQRLVIRTAGNPEAFTAAIRHEIRAIDSRASTESIQPLSAHVAASVAQPRSLAWLLGIFGGSGLLLSIMGIGGVVAYGVSRRNREIAIRIALGARGRDVVWTLMAPSLAAVGIGLTVGIVAAGALGGLARTFLFEIEPHDPLTLGVVVVALGVTALAAAWLPALRAQRIDPLLALRAE
jgi:predicted permease